MTGYKDYYILISPEGQIKDSIRKFKSIAKEIIHNFPSENSPAHLSIKKYHRQKPYMLEQLIDQLTCKIKAMPPVDLQVDNFKFFLHAEGFATVYAAIKPDYKADNWLALLRRVLKLNDNEFTPHITVARKIPMDAFYKVWPRFCNLHCRETFTVDRLYILEKETFNTNAKWSIYRELLFENKLA